MAKPTKAPLIQQNCFHSSVRWFEHRRCQNSFFIILMSNVSACISPNIRTLFCKLITKAPNLKGCVSTRLDHYPCGCSLTRSFRQPCQLLHFARDPWWLWCAHVLGAHAYILSWSLKLLHKRICSLKGPTFIPWFPISLPPRPSKHVPQIAVF